MSRGFIHKTSALSMALCHFKNARRFKWAWQGHALAIQNAETSLERGNARIYRQEAIRLSHSWQNPEKMEQERVVSAK